MIVSIRYSRIQAVIDHASTIWGRAESLPQKAVLLGAGAVLVLNIAR